MSRSIRAGAAIGVALLLAGCAPAPRYAVDPELSSTLSAEVVAVATTASSGDYAGALAQLGELETRVGAAAADEEITASRLVSLQASIARTRTTLTGLADAAAAAEAAAAAQAAQAAAAQEAAAQGAAAAAEQAAADSELSEPTGPPDNKPAEGNGKGNDKGKGNSKKP